MKLTREYIEHWFSQFGRVILMTGEIQKCLSDTFVNVVFVYDDKLVQTYNYQHAYRQLR